MLIKPDSSENTFCWRHPEPVEGLLINRCFDKLSMTMMKGSSNKKIVTDSRAEASKNQCLAFQKRMMEQNSVVQTVNR